MLFRSTGEDAIDSFDWLERNKGSGLRRVKLYMNSHAKEIDEVEYRKYVGQVQRDQVSRAQVRLTLSQYRISYAYVVSRLNAIQNEKANKNDKKRRAKT